LFFIKALLTGQAETAFQIDYSKNIFVASRWWWQDRWRWTAT